MPAADPMALRAAALWVHNVLLGSVATSVAIIAVATAGLLMLAGRIDWRRGMRVVAGCFVLFGAPVIAAGLLGLAGAEQAAMPTASSTAVTEPVVAASPPVPDGYDPYAGASLPGR